KVEVKKTSNEVKISENIKELPKEVIVKKEEKVEVKKTSTNDEIEEPVLKEVAQTRVNEVKIEPTPNKKGLSEIMLDGLKNERKIDTKTEQTLNQAPNQEKQNNENQTLDTSEIKTENITNKTETKITSKQDLTPKASTRETFSSFADDLREKIEQYKPPIMKVQMALNPKALGEVDVTIITRGNNLHVNITSNTNTMTLFTQNQAEFKNSLVNMGFTNLEMNFSDQRQSNNEQGKNSSSTNKEFFEELEEETSTSIELIVPQYV
ncbi:MAG: flagellar hook-length control protein FliK, partial [Campylobacterales bacterium]|nr:flagellar hook-length control protein FliK [Campylobacterales bacterium]